MKDAKRYLDFQAMLLRANMFAAERFRTPGPHNHRSNEGLFSLGEKAQHAFLATDPDVWSAMRTPYLRLGEFPFPADPALLGAIALGARCARVALGVLKGNAGEIGPEEYAMASDIAEYFNRPLGLPEPAPLPSFAAPGEGESVPVATAFTWLAPAKPGRPRGYKRGSVDVPLRGMNSDEAPVAIQVATPDGGWLDLRQFDGEWLRPVLEPGSWKPVTIARFAEAMRSGEAWRDSPATGRSAGDRGAFIAATLPSLYDFSDPAEDARPTPQSTESSEAVRIRCAGLVAIDGHVWRPVPEPKTVLVDIVRTDGPGMRHVVTWRAGDLLGCEPQETLMRPQRGGDFLCYTDGDGGFHVSLPLSCETLLRIAAPGPGVHDRIARLPDGSPLPRPKTAAIVSVADAIDEVMRSHPEVEVLDEAAELKSERLYAVAQFRQACADADPEAVAESAARLATTFEGLWEIISSSAKQDSNKESFRLGPRGVVPPCCQFAHYLADATMQVARANLEALTVDDADGIAEAFSP